jgi:hypothetical protein
MAKYIRVLGQKVKKGKKMTYGAGWRLVATSGDTRVFVGSLIRTFNLDSGKRLALFSVPKP